MSTRTHAHDRHTRQICSRGAQTARDPNAHPQHSGHMNGRPRQWSTTGRGDSTSYQCVLPLGHVRPILGDGGPGSDYLRGTGWWAARGSPRQGRNADLRWDAGYLVRLEGRLIQQGRRTPPRGLRTAHRGSRRSDGEAGRRRAGAGARLLSAGRWLTPAVGLPFAPVT